MYRWRVRFGLLPWLWYHDKELLFTLTSLLPDHSTWLNSVCNFVMAVSFDWLGGLKFLKVYCEILYDFWSNFAPSSLPEFFGGNSASLYTRTLKLIVSMNRIHLTLDITIQTKMHRKSLAEICFYFWLCLLRFSFLSLYRIKNSSISKGKFHKW